MVDKRVATPQVAGPSNSTEATVRYLLLADVTGYTSFLTSVEDAHGVDFSGGIPAGFAIIGALLDAVIDEVRPAFEIAKLEGDAVFATALAADLDGQGAAVIERLRRVDRHFRDVQRQQAAEASDHICVACPTAAGLSVKMVLHRGAVVRVGRAGQSELHGPAVIAVHRLLKNTVRSRIGLQPYILITDAASTALDIAEGIPHDEHYDDIGVVSGRILSLD